VNEFAAAPAQPAAEEEPTDNSFIKTKSKKQGNVQIEVTAPQPKAPVAKAKLAGLKSSKMVTPVKKAVAHKAAAVAKPAPVVAAKKVVPPLAKPAIARKQIVAQKLKKPASRVATKQK